MSSSTV